MRKHRNLHGGSCIDHDCDCHDHDCDCRDHDCDCHSHDCDCRDHDCDCCGRAPANDPDACKQPLRSPDFARQDPNKGVSLGADLEKDIASAMTKRYERFMRPTESFRVTTEVCHHFGLVSSELTSEDRRSHVWAEVSVECEPNKIENPMDAYQEALDVLDLVWLDYFGSERISHYLPIWQSYEFGKRKVNVRLEHCNPAADDEATAFLLAHGFTEGGLEPEPDDEDEFEYNSDNEED